MKEDFLHYLWQYKLFVTGKLIGTKEESILIEKAGLHNKNSGPDFINAHLIIDGQKWVGNVEIHLKSSDWYAHHHEGDVNYDAVILHVVYEDDVAVFMKNQRPLPTLEVKSKISERLLENYNNLVLNTQNWIPCEKDIYSIDSFLLDNWLERLYLERLEDKSKFISELLCKTDNDYEAVLFQLLAKNFGLKVNGDSFLNLAMSVPFSTIRKMYTDEFKLSALLFGQAGFLKEVASCEYQIKLQQEYVYLKHKYKLVPLNNNQFQFFRMRPNNFPTIRLAQLVALYHKFGNLFSKLMKVKTPKEFYELMNVEVNEFWKCHYTFDTSSKKSPKRITKSFINLLIINTIIPLSFVYSKGIGKENITKLLKLMKALPSEKNNVLSKFLEIKIDAKNAFESQGLLQLKNKYCDSKKCTTCAIGNNILLKY